MSLRRNKEMLIYFRLSIMHVTILEVAQRGFPCGSASKASAYNARNPRSISGLGSSPGEGNGNSLQYSCLENLTDGGVRQATVHEVSKSRTRLSNFTFTFFHFHRAYNLMFKAEINQNVYLLSVQGEPRVVYENTVQSKLIQRVREGLDEKIGSELGTER